MFQNISDENDILNDENEFRENRINLLIKEVFKPRNCIIYFLTFLLSIVEIKNNILPFGLAIVGACLGSTIPIFMVYIVSLIAIAIFHSGIGFSSYFYTSLIFFLLLFFFKPKISIDDRNEVFKVGTRLFWASFIYYLIKSIKGTFLASNIFLGFIISLITYTFYKIFVNGIVVIRDFPRKEAWTVEEVIAGSIIVAIAVSVFKNIEIFNISISYLLIIFLIVYIGFKNGTSFGGMTGLAIGASLSLISEIEIFQILVFISSGVLAGIVAHIIMPERFKRVNLNSEILLGNTGERRLNHYEEIKEKINAVAQTISEMNNNFFIKNVEEADTLNKEVYIDNFLELIEEYQENIFYEDVIRNESLIADFFDCLVKEDIITEKDMVQIFQKYNNYILLRDQKLKNDLQELIKIANRTYRELQINSVKVKVKKEEAKKLENELKNVTNIITSITKDDEELNDYGNKEKEIISLLKGKMYPIKNVQVIRCKNGKYIVKLILDYKNGEFREKSKIANIETLISRSLGVKCSFQKDKKSLEKGDYYQVYSADDQFVLQVGSTKISKNGNGQVSR